MKINNFNEIRKGCAYLKQEKRLDGKKTCILNDGDCCEGNCVYVPYINENPFECAVEETVEQKLMQIIKKQHYDILYLLLTYKGDRNWLNATGIAALYSMNNNGLDDCPDQKFSIEEVEKRFKEVSKILEEKKDDR